MIGNSKTQKKQPSIPTDGTILHFQDDTKRNPGKFGWAEKIWIPVGIGIVGVVATGMGTFFGFELSGLQRTNAEAERIIERAIQASNARQEVLTNYAERITDLISRNNLTKYDPNDQSLLPIWNAIRGESIIALKRLDDGRGGGRSEIDLLTEKMELALGPKPDSAQNQSDATSGSEDRKGQMEDLKGFNDSGKLKGELVRFLYESQLLTGVNDQNPEAALLRGADLTRVVLKNAPLPDINLRRAWISWGQFDNANLIRSDLRGTNLYRASMQNTNLEGANLGWADLREANLREADLRGADLRKADLRGADLRGTNLRGADLGEATLMNACYSQRTQGLENMNLRVVGMRDASNATLDKVCADLTP